MANDSEVKQVPDNSFRIFLSHKKEDETLAAELADIVPKPCAGFLKIFRMKEITAGKQWFDEIVENLRAADMLVLLYTDQSAQWNWCMYEAGLFHGMHPSRPVVCLYDAAGNDAAPKSPSPLNQYQSLQVDRGLIGSFLLKLYNNTQTFGRRDPLCNDIKLQDLTGYIDQIMAAFQNRFRPQSGPLTTPYPRKRLQIEMSEIESIRQARIPDGTTVSGDLDLFELNVSQSQWEAFKTKVTDTAGEDCLHELVRELSNVSNGERPALMQSGISGYRPVVDAGKLTSKPFRFDIAFYRDSVNARPIASFSDLMKRLTALLLNTDANSRVYMMALTPAIGFLAEKDEWTTFEATLKTHLAKVDMICQNREDLKIWHDRFEFRYANAGRIIGKEDVKDATDVAETLLGKMRAPTRKPWEELPDFYLFANKKRALIVTPFALPNLDEDEPKELEAFRGGLGNVDMFGCESSDSSVVQRVLDLHGDYKQPKTRAAGA